MRTLDLSSLSSDLADVFARQFQCFPETAPTADVLGRVAADVAGLLEASGVIVDRDAWCYLASMSGLEIPGSGETLQLPQQSQPEEQP
jgi:hypothetical protein